MNTSALLRACSTWLGSSTPTTRNRVCCHAADTMSRVVKNRRRWSPRARWKIDAPCMIVLSTSKNAAAVGSGDTASARSTSAAAADASPASTDRARRSVRRGSRRATIAA